MYGEQYIRNLRVVRSISRPSFPEGKAPAAVLEEIQTNALRCNALMRQNEALLAQFVYDRDPASLTETDIQGLSAFAGRLFNYANSEDMGVAFKVHQLLLAAARSREDVPMIVRELYYTGITLHYINVRDEGTGINLLGDAIQVYFTEAAESMSRYEQLDRNTRQYLIRCVGNTRLGMSRGTHAESCRYLERFRRAMDIIQSAHYHALDPEFPWESYIYSMHMDRMTLLTHLRQEEDPEVARQVLESVCNNDAMALGALQSIQQANRTVGKDIYLVGVDALAEAVQDVLDGNMTGTVLNDDVGQATAAAEATKLYVEGSKVEQYYWVDYVKVTKDNASEYAK